MKSIPVALFFFTLVSAQVHKTLLFSENFTGAINQTLVSNGSIIGLVGWEFEAGAPQSRLRTLTGFGPNGDSALTLDVDFPNFASTQTAQWSVDLSGYDKDTEQLMLEFLFINHGDEAAVAPDHVQVRQNASESWITVFDLHSLGTIPGISLLASADISRAIQPTLQVFSDTFQIRWQQTDDFSTVSFSSDDGFSIDNVEIVGINLVDASVSVSVIYDNLTTGMVRVTMISLLSPISNIPLRYSIDGGIPVTETYIGPLGDGASDTFTFSTSFILQDVCPVSCNITLTMLLNDRTPLNNVDSVFITPPSFTSSSLPIVTSETSETSGAGGDDEDLVLTITLSCGTLCIICCIVAAVFYRTSKPRKVEPTLQKSRPRDDEEFELASLSLVPDETMGQCDYAYHEFWRSLSNNRNHAALFLCKNVSSTEMDKVSRALIRVYLYPTNGEILILIHDIVDYEVEKTTTTETLFRGNSMSSKCIGVYMRMIGINHLKQAIGPTVLQIVANQKEEDVSLFEIDPKKLVCKEDVSKNIKNLEKACSRLLNDIVDAINTIPPEIFAMCKSVYDSVGATFPCKGLVGLGSLLFLRFYCPAIISPKNSHLKLNTQLNQASQRSLVLVSKVILQLANSTPFGSKEVHMKPMNQWLERNDEKLTDHLDNCANPPEQKSHHPSIYIKKPKWEKALKEIATVFVNSGKWDDELRGLIFVHAQRVVDL